MKYYGLFLLCFLLQLNLHTAQAQRSEVYPEQASINHNSAVQNFSSDFVSTLNSSAQTDIAGNNFSISNMAAINMWGDGNTATLNQQGSGILGAIGINGNQNSASLEQSGYFLNSILLIRGNYNTLSMDQSGIGLNNMLMLDGSGLNFEATQTNYGSELRQTGNGAAPFTIQHSGPMPPVIIEKN